MTDIYKQTMGTPYPLGISIQADGINVAIPISCKRECGILITGANKNSIKIPFERSFKVGDLYTILIKDVPFREFSYQLYADDKIVEDPYAQYVYGNEDWGVFHKGKRSLVYGCKLNDFDWENDCCPQIPFHESIFYGLHIRGFTKHSSSKVKAKGTYAGIIEKIPYLKELGITAIVCMPFYDFDEIIINREYVDIKDDIKPFLEEDKKTWEYKLNYWGFTDARYYAPKASFSCSKDPVFECKQMIKELHRNGIECIMRIYFSDRTPHAFIYDVLKYWVIQFHVDGFQILGTNLPMELIANDPLLGRTKILSEYIPTQKICSALCEHDVFCNLATMNDEFMIQARRFLKGDEDMLYTIAMQFRRNPANQSVINYMTNYQGFTLMDLVSYDRKHNDANGEENRDGTEYNFSWNCGYEGKTKKRSVVKLRTSQIKNALIMIFLSQGVPMIQAGDEFGFSTGGNNNPYCQDNAVTWLNWNLLKHNHEIYDYVQKLVQIRKSHPIFHKEEEMRLMDYISCGYPDLSYHGEEAWRPQFENYNRHLGILYCGKYAKIDRKKDDDFIYVAYNMHWDEHSFALPKLPKGFKWYEIINTQESGTIPFSDKIILESQKSITVPPRTIIILTGKFEKEMLSNEGSRNEEGNE